MVVTRGLHVCERRAYARLALAWNLSTGSCLLKFCPCICKRFGRVLGDTIFVYLTPFEFNRLNEWSSANSIFNCDIKDLQTDFSVNIPGSTISSRQPMKVEKSVRPFTDVGVNSATLDICLLKFYSHVVSFSVSAVGFLTQFEHSPIISMWKAMPTESNDCIWHANWNMNPDAWKQSWNNLFRLKSSNLTRLEVKWTNKGCFRSFSSFPVSRSPHVADLTKFLDGRKGDFIHAPEFIFKWNI